MMHAGTGTGSGLNDNIVRRLPTDAKVKNGVATVEWGDPSKKDWESLSFWKEELNNFLDVAVVGKDPKERQKARRVLAALSMPDSLSGPTQSKDANPLAGLEPEGGLKAAVGAVGHCSNPFVFAERFLEIDEAVRTTASWLRVDVSGHEEAALGCAIFSYCRRVQDFMRPLIPIFDRRMSNQNRQRERVNRVGDVLSSMKEVGSGGLQDLKGVLGPLVQVKGEEPMRAVYWTLGPMKQRRSLALCLLPEDYLRYMLRDYMGKVIPATAKSPWGVGVGFTSLVLRDADKVKLADEVGDDTYYPRETHVWKTAANVVGARLHCDPSVTYEARAASDDPLLGVHVKWYFWPKWKCRLTADDLPDGDHLLTADDGPDGDQYALQRVIGIRV